MDVGVDSIANLGGKGFLRPRLHFGSSVIGLVVDTVTHGTGVRLGAMASGRSIGYRRKRGKSGPGWDQLVHHLVDYALSACLMVASTDMVVSAAAIGHALGSGFCTDVSTRLLYLSEWNLPVSLG